MSVREDAGQSVCMRVCVCVDVSENIDDDQGSDIPQSFSPVRDNR